MIKGSKCDCGKSVVPQRKLCPVCGKDMQEYEFENKGTVLTYTTLHAPPSGFEGPIRLALVELDDQTKLMCGIKGELELQIGNAVSIIQEGDLFFCEPTKQ